jgi:Rrf2 family protein
MRLTLTKETEYALRALVWLARAEATEAAAAAEAGHAGGPVSRHKAAAISSAATIPPHFATRVLAHLQRQGLLRARAGQQGGYTLARPASDVSLLDVIEAVEGPLQTRTCVLRDAACSSDGTCVLHNTWRAAQSALREVLEGTTLATAVPSAVPSVGYLANGFNSLSHELAVPAASLQAPPPSISAPAPVPARAARSPRSEPLAASPA